MPGVGPTFFAPLAGGDPFFSKTILLHSGADFLDKSTLHNTMSVGPNIALDSTSASNNGVYGTTSLQFVNGATDPHFAIATASAAFKFSAAATVANSFVLEFDFQMDATPSNNLCLCSDSFSRFFQFLGTPSVQFQGYCGVTTAVGLTVSTWANYAVVFDAPTGVCVIYSGRVAASSNAGTITADTANVTFGLSTIGNTNVPTGRFMNIRYTKGSTRGYQTASVVVGTTTIPDPLGPWPTS